MAEAQLPVSMTCCRVWHMHVNLCRRSLGCSGLRGAESVWAALVSYCMQDCLDVGIARQGQPCCGVDQLLQDWCMEHDLEKLCRVRTAWGRLWLVPSVQVPL